MLGGPSIGPPRCRETPVSQTALRLNAVIFPSFCYVRCEIIKCVFAQSRRNYISGIDCLPTIEIAFWTWDVSSFLYLSYGIWIFYRYIMYTYIIHIYYAEINSYNLNIYDKKRHLYIGGIIFLLLIVFLQSRDCILNLRCF